jgi:hypothetical protein
MAKRPTEFYIFGKDLVNLVQFVLFDCKLSQQSEDLIKVSRAIRDANNNLRLLPSVVRPTVSCLTKSVHLNDIFLSPKFGLLIQFNDDAYSFALDDQMRPHDLVTTTDKDGKELSITSFVHASKFK